MTTGIAAEVSTAEESPRKGNLSLFYLWTFVLAGRPQDFIPFLAHLRPALLLALAMLPSLFVRTTGGSGTTGSTARSKQLRLFGWFVGMLALSIPLGYYPWQSFLALFTKYINAVLFVFCFYALVDTVPRLKATLLCLCVGAVFYGVFSLAEGKMIENRLVLVGTSHPAMFDPNDLAFFIVSLLPYNLLFIGKRDFWLTRLACLANLVMGPVIVLLSGSRGGFVAFSVLVLMLVFMKNETVKRGYKTALVALLLVAGIGVGSAVDLSRFSTILSAQQDYNLTGDQGRWEIWKTGLRLMVRHPVAGVGMDCFSMAIGQDREQRGVQARWQDAHNSWVQAGTETGVVGFVLFGLLNLNAYRSFARARKKSRGDLRGIAGLAQIGFAGHFVGAMFLTQAYSFYWAFYIGLSAVVVRLLEKENGENGPVA